MMVSPVEIDERTFWVRPVGHEVLRSGNVVSTALAESLDKSYPWAVGFLFGNTQLSLELWNIIPGISGFDDWGGIRCKQLNNNPLGLQPITNLDWLHIFYLGIGSPILTGV